MMINGPGARHHRFKKLVLRMELIDYLCHYSKADIFQGEEISARLFIKDILGPLSRCVCKQMNVIMGPPDFVGA